MTLVTISATYGCGGSRIAPALAERLGVPLLGRPPAPDLDPEVEEPERPPALALRLAGAGVGDARRAWSSTSCCPTRRGREQIEQEVRELAATGEGVILGRGAAVILHDDARALHVLLDGPREARVRQAMAIEGLDHEAAERRLSRVDRFRRAYVETVYGVDLKRARACATSSSTRRRCRSRTASS